MRDRSSLEARFNRRMRGRKGEYREDCTDGSLSVLNPVTFKGDALIQVWMDSRELATISEFLDKNGYRTRFMSEVVKEGLHILCEELVSYGEVNMVEDTAVARKMIEDKYGICLNPRTAKSKYTGNRDSRRGEKNALHNMLLSERKREEVPDKLRELQMKTKETYARLNKVENREGGDIFKELMEMERGGDHVNTTENRDE